MPLQNGVLGLEQGERQARLLVVDDDEDDFFLLKTAMAGQSNILIESIGGGRELFERLEGFGPARPEDLLIVLDLHMPQMDGFATLARLKLEARWRSVPVVVWSSAAHEEEIDRVYELGANCFVKKSLHFDRLIEIGKGLARYFSRREGIA